MLAIISPAKNLDEKSDLNALKTTEPLFLKDSEIIMETLKKKRPAALSKLMNISKELSELNFDRNQDWSPEMTRENTRPAVRMFRGDVYLGMMPWEWNEADYEFAQSHLLILSGLHGVLRPMDRIKPYRLEMGTNLKIGRRKNLYDYWGDKITDQINESLKKSGSDTLINLASKEYFAAVNKEKINGRIIGITPKEFRNGQYKFIMFSGKKARGLIARYIIENKITEPSELKHFDVEGYAYNPDISTDEHWVFSRGN